MKLDRWITPVVVLLCIGLGGCYGCKPPSGRVIPTSTSSEEALELFLKGREALDALRLEEAHSFFKESVAKDPEFAMAHLGLAESSPTEEEFRNHLLRAMMRARTITEGERLLIRAVHAGHTHNLNAEFEYFSQVARRYPDDERAQVRLGDFYFARDNAAMAIRSYRKALELTPEFVVPYRRLAEAYASGGKFKEAEKATKKYLKKYSAEASAHNLYGALLMKAGRFEESNAAYEQARSLAPGDTEATIGIGNNLLFLGQGGQARAEFRKLLEQAPDEATKTTAYTWLVAALVHEGDIDAALAELRKAYEEIDPGENPLGAAEILELLGNVMLETGDPEGAITQFTKRLDLIQGAAINEYDKRLARGDHLYYEARVALDRQDPETARDKMADYRRIVGEHWVAGASERYNELMGRVELAEGSPQMAIRRLLLAGRDDPRIMYVTATAYRQFDERKWRSICERLVNYNEPDFGLAYVRAKAQQQLADL
jgi:tetratricopeptide (TPR) repeat protein